jgi:hypothetical protein
MQTQNKHLNQIYYSVSFVFFRGCCALQDEPASFIAAELFSLSKECGRYQYFYVLMFDTDDVVKVPAADDEL